MSRTAKLTDSRSEFRAATCSPTTNHPLTMTKKKSNKPRNVKKPQASEFWVIDTDSPGMSLGQYSATGPYPNQAAAEAYIIADTHAVWRDSCACLQSDADLPFCRPLHIVQVIRTVQPDIYPVIELLDA